MIKLYKCINKMNNLNVLKLGFFFVLLQILVFIDYLCDYFLYKKSDFSSEIECIYVYKLEFSYYLCIVFIFRMKSLKK